MCSVAGCSRPSEARRAGRCAYHQGRICSVEGCIREKSSSSEHWHDVCTYHLTGNRQYQNRIVAPNSGTPSTARHIRCQCGRPLLKYTSDVSGVRMTFGTRRWFGPPWTEIQYQCPRCNAAYRQSVNPGGPDVFDGEPLAESVWDNPAVVQRWQKRHSEGIRKLVFLAVKIAAVIGAIVYAYG